MHVNTAEWSLLLSASGFACEIKKSTWKPSSWSQPQKTIVDLIRNVLRSMLFNGSRNKNQQKLKYWTCELTLSLHFHRGLVELLLRTFSSAQCYAHKLYIYHKYMASHVTWPGHAPCSYWSQWCRAVFNVLRSRCNTDINSILPSITTYSHAMSSRYLFSLSARISVVNINCVVVSVGKQKVAVWTYQVPIRQFWPWSQHFDKKTQ